MNKFKMIFVGFLILLLAGSVISAGENDVKTEEYSLWIGTHYTDFTDYTKKVGKYNLGNDELLPEFMVNYLSKSSNGMFSIDGHYFDDQNILGKVKTTVSDKFKAKFQYRSMTLQEGQDLRQRAAPEPGE